jgi:hypothetical protein
LRGGCGFILGINARGLLQDFDKAIKPTHLIETRSGFRSYGSKIALGSTDRGVDEPRVLQTHPRHPRLSRSRSNAKGFGGMVSSKIVIPDEE